MRRPTRRAPGMHAYMKSAKPYLGVRVRQVRAIVRAGARSRPPACTAQLVDTVRALWFDAQYREERYAATALLGTPSARRLCTPDLITLHAELIVSGAWWDHVDELAHRVGELLLAYPGDRPGRASLAARVRPVTAACLDHLPARRTAADRSRTTRRRAPDQRLRQRLLFAKGDRLGVARLRPHRTGVGPHVRRAARRTQPAVAA